MAGDMFKGFLILYLFVGFEIGKKIFFRGTAKVLIFYTFKKNSINDFFPSSSSIFLVSFECKNQDPGFGFAYFFLKSKKSNCFFFFCYRK